MGKPSAKQVVKLQAYCACNNVSKSDLKLPEHKQVIDNALRELQMYDRLFEGETETMRLDRYDLPVDDNDDPSALASYFTELYPEDFSNIPSRWGVIFTMYNRMKGSKTSEVEETGIGSVLVEAKEEVKDRSDIKNKELKEKERMANQAEIDAAWNEMNENMETALEGTSIQMGEGATPKDVDSSSITEATAALLGEEQEARKIYSANSKVIAPVLSRPKKEDVLVEGKEATGVPMSTKYDDIIEKIIEKAGVKVDEGTGVVTATNCKTPDDAKAALQMYQMMQDLKDHKEVVFKVYMSTAVGSFLGFYFQEAGEDAPKYVTKDTLLKNTVEKGIGLVSSTIPSVQGQIKNVISAERNAKRVADRSRSNKQQKDYAGMVTLRWTSKEDLLSNAQYLQEIVGDEVKEDAQGYKSDLKFKYVAERDDKGNPVKYGTYRIPLTAKARVLKALDQAKTAVFGVPGDRATGPIDKIDMNDAKQVTGIMNDLATLLSLSAAESSSEFAGRVRERAAQMTEEKTNEQASEVSGDL